MSREVNRGRATFTLIDQLFEHAKGGKRVSVAALKGFAFAWLFPRTMIVVGSIVSGLVLVVQTWIVYQQKTLMDRQNDLLASQTAAAQVAQAEQLRNRIDENAALVSKLRTFQSVSITPAAEAWELLPDAQVNMAVRRRVSRNQRLPSTEQGQGTAEEALNTALDALEQAAASYGQSARETVDKAQPRCALPEALVAETSSALIAVQRFSTVDQLSSEYRRYFNVIEGMNAVMGFESRRSPKGKRVDDGSGGLRLFQQKLADMRMDLQANFQTAVDLCKDKIRADQQQVLSLEAPKEGGPSSKHSKGS